MKNQAMKYRVLIIIGLTLFGVLAQSVAVAQMAHGLSVKSPDGHLSVDFTLDEQGVARYEVALDGKQVLQPSRLGLVREDADFSRKLKWVGDQPVERVVDDYTLLTSKRRLNHYVANRKVIELRGANSENIQIIFQVSDDGLAFRYYFPVKSAKLRKLKEESTSFNFLAGTRAWVQPAAVAKSGWNGTNPSYEEYYDKDVELGSPSPTGSGWVYPALFKTGDTWLLVSEGSLPRNYAGTRLRSQWHNTEYTISFPDPQERIGNGAVNPESLTPWLTPWRMIVVGDLETIVESTLGTDLADKPAVGSVTSINAPGKASWSWPLLGDDKTVFDVQKQFIDYAATMHWQYTLIDSMWDTQIGDDKLKQLVDYAKTKDIKILVWYNSAGDWNTAPLTPRNRMLTHESRIAEFEKLKAMGVAGLKVDFFGGDGQSVIAYYHDILEDAAPYGFLMNFHGATLPRGWQRTYPNLMTMEAIRGLEYVTFDQKNAEEEPIHAAMLPFTRNVFDPMDFTPVVLDHIKNIERRTSSAFELALSVLFTSGITHYAEIPEGMAKAPDYVQEFLRHVPSIWDDVQFLDGFPGKYVVIARQGDGRWYISGINAEKAEKTLNLSLASLPIKGRGTLITDGSGGNLSFRKQDIDISATKMLEVSLKARGGFVLVLE
ncbi:MAG TPA: glycoside hydrolase family 97 catalytic domain-containing protein [Steroidobacteraceae bacterium]|nr:glycoside hydrolase family 97 catalytic domain-containing protein [Steroidobacteraceae bacterium]